jgi:hypothetical protein
VNIPVNCSEYAQLLLDWVMGRDEINFSSWSGKIVYGEGAEAFLKERLIDEVEVFAFAIKNEDIHVIHLKNEMDMADLHAKYDGVCSPHRPHAHAE